MIYSNSKRSSRNSNTTNEAPTRRRRYLACMYNYIISVKTAFKDYSIYKNGYDPYQMKQFADESKFDPYHNSSHEVNNAEMERIDSDSDDSEATLYETNNENLPPAKRIRTMAAAAVDNVAHALLYGSFAAINFVWSEKKTLEEYYFQDKSNSTINFVDNSHQPTKKRKVIMRGFGVDFNSISERPAALQTRIDDAERNLRDICLRTRESVQDAVITKAVQSCGGNKQLVPSKRSFDDTWGFVDNDLSVNFKPTMPPQKPQRRVFKQPIQLRRGF